MTIQRLTLGKLHNEAESVFASIGLTPSQLVEQRSDFLAALEELREQWRDDQLIASEIHANQLGAIISRTFGVVKAFDAVRDRE